MLAELLLTWKLKREFEWLFDACARLSGEREERMRGPRSNKAPVNFGNYEPDSCMHLSPPATAISYVKPNLAGTQQVVQ
jgi:hypothetical protein